jgi:hypothetical protein
MIDLSDLVEPDTDNVRLHGSIIQPLSLFPNK